MISEMIIEINKEICKLNINQLFNIFLMKIINTDQIHKVKIWFIKLVIVNCYKLKY